MESKIEKSEVTAEFKLLLVGDNKVGKTAFINRHPIEKLEKKTIGAIDVEVNLVKLVTSYGTIQFNIWEALGVETAEQLTEDFYINADCAIIMFDLTSRMSYKNVPLWYKEIIKYNEDIPITLVGNKIDEKDIKVKAKHITFHRKKNLTYNGISALANYRWECPFVDLMKLLCNDSSLSLVEAPPLRAPDISMSEEKIQHIEEERKLAEAPLPEDDDL